MLQLLISNLHNVPDEERSSARKELMQWELILKTLLASDNLKMSNKHYIELS